MNPTPNLLAALLLAPLVTPHAAESSPAEWMMGKDDCTQLWWTEGSPKVFNNQTRPTEETLGFQFGTKQMLFDTRRVRPVEGEWECAVVAEGRRFVCSGHVQPADEWQQPVRFVESGRFFQRVVIDGLTFADAEGRAFGGTARLEISVWPDRLAFRLESENDAMMEMRHGEKKVSGSRSVLLEVLAGASKAVVESELAVTRDAALGCHRLELPEKPWSNAGGTYYPEEHLDRIDRWRVTVRNDADEPTVARLLFTQQKHLPITGFTPMLCELDGTPTGIPVQLSKNWHIRAEKGRLPHDGQWFHGFAWVRVPPKSRREFVFQMVYARYGGVCAASHAQLCLIGWGHNQFWDEAALGSFGESICYEPGRVQRRCFIDDVRPLMTLPAAGGKPWGWAENCGGGDFLVWLDEHGAYQGFRATRTDYRAQGPCLTDVRYLEETTGGEIAARMDVSLARSDDYLRAFHHVRYDVRQPVKWKRLAFYQLGADFYNDTPARRVAVGDARGVRDEWAPPQLSGGYDRRSVPLVGEQPWISIHGLDRAALRKGSAAASRGLILRSWRARLGGKDGVAPHFSTYGNEWGKGNFKTVLELSPPPDLTGLVPGDFVEAEIELVVFPADAKSYYGPNEPFRAALAVGADTWRLVHREASGNALRVNASRGTVRRNFPLRLAVDRSNQAEAVVHGGVGWLPVTFTGLTNHRGFEMRVNGHTFNQSVHGNDYWQTDYDSQTGTWSRTFNLPRDDREPLRLEFGPQARRSK